MGRETRISRSEHDNEAQGKPLLPDVCPHRIGSGPSSLIKPSLNHRSRDQRFKQLVFRDAAVETRIVSSQVSVEATATLDEVCEAGLLIPLGLGSQGIEGEFGGSALYKG